MYFFVKWTGIQSIFTQNSGFHQLEIICLGILFSILSISGGQIGTYLLFMMLFEVKEQCQMFKYNMYLHLMVLKPIFFMKSSLILRILIQYNENNEN